MYSTSSSFLRMHSQTISAHLFSIFFSFTKAKVLHSHVSSIMPYACLASARVSFAFSTDGLWLGLSGTIERRLFPSKSTAGASCWHGSDSPFSLYQ
jgi:hypothetical protein